MARAGRIWTGGLYSVTLAPWQEGDVLIYGLCFMPSREVLWIGQTKEPWARYANHVSTKGIRVAMFKLEIVPPERADEREAYWDAAFRAKGANLMCKDPNRGRKAEKLVGDAAQRFLKTATQEEIAGSVRRVDSRYGMADHKDLSDSA